MKSTIAQAVALTCHGNAAVRRMPGSKFFPTHSACQVCDEVTFARIKKSFFGRPREERVAQTPDEWFELLLRNGARGCRLVRDIGSGPSDHMSAGFVGGGGEWFIEEVGADGNSCFWLARWNVWNQKAAQNRIWRVKYDLVAERRTESANPPALAAVRTELLDALNDIEAFARELDYGSFADCFAEAVASLTAHEPRHGYYRDLAPTGLLDDQASRMLDACGSAWVFGGMGSWNDLPFLGADQERYGQVSKRLFTAVNSSIAASANTSFAR